MIGKTGGLFGGRGRGRTGFWRGKGDLEVGRGDGCVCTLGRMTGRMGVDGRVGLEGLMLRRRDFL